MDSDHTEYMDWIISGQMLKRKMFQRGNDDSIIETSRAGKYSSTIKELNI